MKKFTLTLSIFALLFTFNTSSYGQELLNGGFENWDDATTPTSWEKAENCEQEIAVVEGDNANVRSGFYSVKHTGGTKDLGQTVTGIVAGKTYKLSMWYKVVENDGDDARIWSFWKDGAGAGITDATTLDALKGPNNLYFDNNSGVWTEYTTTVVAPTDAEAFYFEVRTYSGAVTYWDDFSFAEDGTTGISNIENNSSLSIFPNPSNGTFTVNSEKEISKISVYDVTGKVVYTNSSVLNNNIKINAETGVYFVEVTSDSKTMVEKLIIK